MTVYGIFYWRYTQFEDYPIEFFQTLCESEEIAKQFCLILAKKYKINRAFDNTNIEIKFSEYVFSDNPDFLGFEYASDDDERAYGYGLYEPEYNICSEAVIYKPIEVRSSLLTESR